jgi:hypothetical protein
MHLAPEILAAQNEGLNTFALRAGSVAVVLSAKTAFSKQEFPGLELLSSVLQVPEISDAT